ncbi:hypothetical protein BDW69DRAFT_172822 [Aspergillus filifer]
MEYCSKSLDFLLSLSAVSVLPLLSISVKRQRIVHARPQGIAVPGPITDDSQTLNPLDQLLICSH